ncbi:MULTISPECIES: hypothetical protein [Clostridium]|uniref:Uncharacterized protein n=1 Tax=Clostridium frigoriphilum TaxID=443253 RepID=A0ABU7UT67_9CLOT|nr:hypothetical protein [Clostridium sp. DSM 17811]MBU3100588.1 hypothetical protein [Clostridium sp. DSM 17811]
MRDLSEEVRNETIKKTIEELINKPFDIFKHPLHKSMIIQINNTQYECN